jgi:uncharacterized protein with HEPN domain
MEDIKTQDAVVRNLEIIGEATKNLSVNARRSHSKVPWKELMGMRDKMIHHYFGINYEIVWTIAKGELADLLPQIEKILSKENWWLNKGWVGIREFFTPEEIASAIGAEGEVEMVFKSLEHAAANLDHPIKKIPADPPFRSRYQYGPWVM